MRSLRAFRTELIWYEQGHLLNKKHSFEDFVDAVRALQRAGLATIKYKDALTFYECPHL